MPELVLFLENLKRKFRKQIYNLKLIEKIEKNICFFIVNFAFLLILELILNYHFKVFAKIFLFNFFFFYKQKLCCNWNK